MAILLLDRFLEKQSTKWKSNTDLDINDPPSASFSADPLPDGSLLVTNVGLDEFAGGLVSNKRPYPKLNGKALQYVGLRIKFLYNANTYANLARHELDLKVCIKTRKDPNVPERNVADFSTQWNHDTGQFMIDYDTGPDTIPLWINTGYIVPEIPPNVWHTQTYRFYYDDETYSVLSIQLDDNEPYLIPEELRNVLLTNTNWEEIASVQLQNEMWIPGTTQIQYSDIEIAWSDQPIREF
jgi:hypothetical protein